MILDEEFVSLYFMKWSLILNLLLSSCQISYVSIVQWSLLGYSMCSIYGHYMKRGQTIKAIFKIDSILWGQRASFKWWCLSLLLSYNFKAVFHNDIFLLLQTTLWCAPSPTLTLWSTLLWCPSICRLLSLCWFTSASTSSSGWGGRGSLLDRPVGRCSQAPPHRLWWVGFHY